MLTRKKLNQKNQQQFLVWVLISREPLVWTNSCNVYDACVSKEYQSKQAFQFIQIQVLYLYKTAQETTAYF